MESGAYVEPAKTTVAHFFERWLKYIKPNVSPRTHERYEQIATKNICPLLGGNALSKLQLAVSSRSVGGFSDGEVILYPRCCVFPQSNSPNDFAIASLFRRHFFDSCV